MALPKKDIFKWIAAAMAVLAALLSCVLLQRWEEFTFFYREQNQLFLYDCPDILSKLGGIGGFAMVVSQFFVQFFKLPWAGSLQTALLGACAAIILWKTFKKSLTDRSYCVNLARLHLREFFLKCCKLNTDFIQARAEVPKWLKGLPWKGSRSLVTVRGFKSLLLRYEH